MNSYRVADFKAQIIEAGHLQTFSALLTAFVFAAIIIVLTNPPENKEKTPIFP